jgi:hypothetical protein
MTAKLCERCQEAETDGRFCEDCAAYLGVETSGAARDPYEPAALTSEGGTSAEEEEQAAAVADEGQEGEGGSQEGQAQEEAGVSGGQAQEAQ